MMLGGYRLEVDLPGLPPLNSASNMTWKAKIGKRKTWAKIIGFCVPKAKRPQIPLEHARVMITRFSSAPPDFDNLGHAAKWVLDELQSVGVLSNDNAKCIGSPTLKWEKVRPKNGHTLVIVEQCEASDLDQSAWEFEIGGAA